MSWRSPWGLLAPSIGPYDVSLAIGFGISKKNAGRCEIAKRCPMCETRCFAYIYAQYIYIYIYYN